MLLSMSVWGLRFCVSINRFKLIGLLVDALWDGGGGWD